MGLLERVAAQRAAMVGRRPETRSSIDTWIGDFLQPAAGQFAYSGVNYPYGNWLGLNQTLAGNRAAEIANSLPGYTHALMKSPPAFAAQLVRALVLSQARFTFRRLPSVPRPRQVFGTQALSVLEKPWPKATTGEMISRLEWHAGLAGNAYLLRQPDRLRVLRPDWVAVLWGSESDPEDPAGALDSTLLAFVYWNCGYHSGHRPQVLLPDEVAWWSPLPDPLSPGMGMSWLTPALREIQADDLMTQHKQRYFENGATPNMVVTGLPFTTREKFLELVDVLEERHAGTANAYKTLYLTAGADATVVGGNLQQLDFKSVQGASETRISALSRVPAPILGISEGLAGSALNAGNFGQSRRLFADTWVYPTLSNLADALGQIVDVPADAQLWFDTTDVPLLREDAKDVADIQQQQAATMRQLVDGGFEPDSVVTAVTSQDMTLLKHSGLVSVQLLPPGQGQTAAPTLPGAGPAADAAGDGGAADG